MIWHINMKKIVFLLIALIVAGGLLWNFQYRSRATSSIMLLVKVTYNNDAEFENAFDGSTSVHYFYEQPTSANSFMISKMTVVQHTKLLAQGFKTEIIEENPDMTKYMVAYSPQAAPIQSFAEIGEADALDSRFTLVKAGSADQYLHHDSLMSSDTPIFSYDIAKPLTKPPYKTVRANP